MQEADEPPADDDRQHGCDHAGGEHLGHEAASTRRSRPTLRDALSSTTSPGCSSAGRPSAAASTSANQCALGAIEVEPRAAPPRRPRGRSRRSRAPISRCSSSASGPSSAISPSTATRRPSPAPRVQALERGPHRRGVRVVRVVDHHAPGAPGELLPAVRRELHRRGPVAEARDRHAERVGRHRRGGEVEPVVRRPEVGAER